MEIEIVCHFWFESYHINIDGEDGNNFEIWDCDICCNPNHVSYKIIKGHLIQIEISNGND